jgi:UDPglucose--hexose-1-phosphate uridylyltransferase
MSELRRDSITGRCVIVAPERLLSKAAFERPAPVGAIGGDMCPFCEGQEHVAGRELLAWRPPHSPYNGPGWQVRVVVNREPALRVESQLGEAADPLFQSFGGIGAHEVVIEHPRHNATLATMSGEEVQRVLWAWRERMRDLRRDIRLKSFLIVKNVGANAGATLDHPHSQLLAMPLVPRHLEDELSGGRNYFARTNRCVFCDLVEQEIASEQRVIASDDQTIAFAPFASRVPFETWIMPRAHQPVFEDLDDAMMSAIAERLRDVMARLHRVLVSPPYTLLLHSAPVADAADAQPAAAGGDAAPPAGTPDSALRTGTSDSALRTGTPDSALRTSHSFLRTPDFSSCYDWHIEIIPRLLPVPGLAWDGGLHINPVAPEEAAHVLRRL